MIGRLFLISPLAPDISYVYVGRKTLARLIDEKLELTTPS